MNFIDDFELPSCSEAIDSPLLLKKTTTRQRNSKKSTKPIKLGPSICEVCYGRATGHHYDVASCNGCKSFFRRVTIEKLKYTCQSDNDCFADLKVGESPPKCRACRFKRCLEAGMNHLGIQSEMRKMEEMKKHEVAAEMNAESVDNLDLVVLPKLNSPPLTIESQVTDLIQQLIYLDLKTVAFRDSAFNPHTVPTLRESVKNENSLLTIADRVGPMPEWPIDPKNEQEIYKDGPPSWPRYVKKWTIYDLLVMVELVKTFPFYSKLSEEDRYFLLRDTVLMASNLSRAYHSFEVKSDCLVRPDGLVYYGSHRRFLSLVSVEVRDKLVNDVSRRCLNALLRLKPEKVEFILIRMIVFCNNAVPDLSAHGQKLVSSERDKYTVALFRYIMAKNGANGPSRFANILNIIDVLEHQQRDQRDINVYFRLLRKDVKISLLDEVMRI